VGTAAAAAAVAYSYYKKDIFALPTEHFLFLLLLSRLCVSHRADQRKKKFQSDNKLNVPFDESRTRRLLRLAPGFSFLIFKLNFPFLVIISFELK
jgi:hypothetical protein